MAGKKCIDRSLVSPIKNALIFRFLTRKLIGVKDLEAALNAIWRTNAPVNLYAIGDGIFFSRVQEFHRLQQGFGKTALTTQ